MSPVTIHQSLSTYDDVKVVLAGDGNGHRFVGVVVQDTRPGAFLFMEIDRVTWLELERGQVDLYTVMAERALGPSFESSNYATLDTAPH